MEARGMITGAVSMLIAVPQNTKFGNLPGPIQKTLRSSRDGWLVDPMPGTRVYNNQKVADVGAIGTFTPALFASLKSGTGLPWQLLGMWYWDMISQDYTDSQAVFHSGILVLTPLDRATFLNFMADLPDGSRPTVADASFHNGFGWPVRS
jgi:hypothetical protein